MKFYEHLLNRQSCQITSYDIFKMFAFLTMTIKTTWKIIFSDVLYFLHKNIDDVHKRELTRYALFATLI